MNLHRHIIIACATACGLLTACNEPQDPTYLPPTVDVEEAREVTRTSAVLTGEIHRNGTGEVTWAHFCYGTSAETDEHLSCDPDDAAPSVRLTGLTPNTTYFYCLEAGNGSSTVQSPTLSFTTLPNETPTVGSLTVLNQGPVSITLQYEVTDNGGEPLTATGVYCRADNGEETAYPIDNVQGQTFRIRLGDLHMQTDYTVEAYARNSVGETRSQPLHFHTEQAVLTTTAGTLSEIIGEENKYRFETLRIVGPLNGTDLRFLREMMGIDARATETPGKLNTVDLTNATLQAGGLSYDGIRFLEDNIVGYGLFADCRRLKQISLPESTVKIAENAFRNCTLLESFRIPAATTDVLPSDNCPALLAIDVAADNAVFLSLDGILYDKQLTCLYWHPQGRKQAPSLPNTLQSIGSYAFRNYQPDRIELPAALRSIGQHAFNKAQITSIELPDGVDIIASGLFQECTRLVSVKLGNQTSYLSEYCFDQCPLQHLTVTTELFPPTCRQETFAGSEYLFQTCTLHVPTGYLNIYRNDEYWGRFEKVVEGEWDEE